MPNLNNNQNSFNEILTLIQQATKQVYQIYNDNEKLSTLWRQLNWSNNRTIFSRCKREEEREFYLNFTIKEGWGNRELERQISSSLFERVLMANKKLSPVVRELRKLKIKV